MKRRGRILYAIPALALAAASAAAQLPAGDLRVSAVLASDYRHNGLSQTGDEISLRAAVDYERAGGLFTGGYVANVDYWAERFFARPRELEIGVYGGYQWRRPNWSTNVQLARYVYPDIEISYDYTEARVNLALRDRYFVSLGTSDDYLGLFGRSTEARAGVVLPLVRQIELGINAGRFEATETGYTKYDFWDIGLSRATGRFALDLRYHDNNYAGASLYGDPGEQEFVLSVAYAIRPRAADRR